MVAPPPPVHRTSPGLLIGVVALLVLVMVAAMFGIGLLFLHETSAPNPNPVALNPSSAPSAPAPAGGSDVITTSSFQVSARGWKLLKRDTVSVTLLTPQGDGTLYILGGQLTQPTDSRTFVANFMADLSKKHPDATLCLKPSSRAQGGKDGVIAGVCYSYTPPAGAAFPAADVVWASVDANDNVFMYEVFCDRNKFDAVYNKEVLPVIADASLQWAA